MSASVWPSTVSKYLKDRGFTRFEGWPSEGFRVVAIDRHRTRVEVPCLLSHQVPAKLTALSEALSDRYEVEHNHQARCLIITAKD